MKGIFLFAAMALASFSSAASHYGFVKNFRLLDVEIQKDIALITLEHPSTFGETRFELIPNPVCLESFPPQCSATVVRLDQGPHRRGTQVSQFEVDLNGLFPYGGPPVYISFIGPKSGIRKLWGEFNWR